MNHHARETGERRSAVVRKALRFYFARGRARAIDESYALAYGGKADEVYDEFAELIGGQPLPEP